MKLDSNTMAQLIRCQVLLDELALGLIRLQQVSGHPKQQTQASRMGAGLGADFKTNEK